MSADGISHSAGPVRSADAADGASRAAKHAPARQVHVKPVPAKQGLSGVTARPSAPAAAEPTRQAPAGDKPTVPAGKLAEDDAHRAHVASQASTKSQPPAGAKPPFQSGRSEGQPSGAGLGEKGQSTHRLSGRNRQATQAGQAAPVHRQAASANSKTDTKVAAGHRPATSAKSTGISFDSRHNLQNGTFQDYFNGQLRRLGGGAFITTDAVWGDARVEQVQVACDNVADLISHSGARVLYTDVVDNQALLNRLVGYENPEIMDLDHGGPADGGPPKADDLKALVNEIRAKRAKEHPEDPIASRTNEKADSDQDLTKKATAYVRMLRIAQRSGANVQALNGEAIKAKPASGAGRSATDTYIILGSGEKEKAKVGGAGLPVFQPDVTANPDLMNSGVISKISQNKVIFDPTVTPTAWNGISFDANGNMENGTVLGLFNSQMQGNPGVFIEDNILNRDSRGPVPPEKIASMLGALGTVIAKANEVETVYTDLVPEPLLSDLVSREQKPTREDIEFLAAQIEPNTLNSDNSYEAMISKLGSYVDMLRNLAARGIPVKNIDEIGSENAAGKGTHKYVVIGDYAKMSWNRSVAKLPQFHLNVHGDVARSPNLKNTGAS